MDFKHLFHFRPLRASSYEPGNQVGSFTRTNLGNFSPVNQDEIQETKPKVALFATIIALSTLLTLLRKLI